MKLTRIDFPYENQKFLKDDFELNVLINNMEFKQSYKILEVGCNNTELSNTLHEVGCEVWGVDVNQNNEAKFKFIKGNFQDLGSDNIPKDYFDIVIEISAIHHFGLGNYGDKIDEDADIKSVKKIYECLKKGGLFYISMDRVGKDFVSNVGNYYRQYNIPQFYNRIVDPCQFEILELKFYENNKYPLTEVNPVSKSIDGTQMFAVLRKS